MKKIILIVATILLTVACSKDENEPTVPNPLIGTWEWIDEIVDMYGDIRIITRIYTFSSNKTFSGILLAELNGGGASLQNTASGTYSIYENKVVTLHMTFDDSFADPNVDYYITVGFKTGSDAKGDYLVFGDPDDDFSEGWKFYKK